MLLSVRPCRFHCRLLMYALYFILRIGFLFPPLAKTALSFLWPSHSETLLSSCEFLCLAVSLFRLTWSNLLLGQGSPFPRKDVLVELGVTLHKDTVLAVAAEDLPKGRLQQPDQSPPSSPDVLEEFLTPDTEFFSCSPGLPTCSEAEIPAGDEERREQGDLGISQEISGQTEHPIETGGNSLTSDAKGGHLCKAVPGEDLCTPVASTGTAPGVKSGEPQGAIKESDISLIDIQDLSSISCDDSCKPRARGSPRSTLSPADASTPRSSAEAAFSSAPVKCKMAPDTTCFSAEEASLLGLSTFSATWARGKIPEVTSLPQDPAAGRSEPGDFLDLGAWLPRGRGQQGTGEPSPPPPPPPPQQSELQEAVPGQADSEEQELEEVALNKCLADCSFWGNETVCLLEETERAHSTLDNVLEGVLWPLADGCNLHKEPLDPVKREPTRLRYGNIEMKGDGGESFSESECSAENAEGLDS
ncbi:inactive serine/threonine-protein kinase TEX14-like [Varanus komodoensis]|uniref:inactive serine/threonine-protein kinase TEX14-like n=1 Tax=Varanus komodoensis TaxID=61221 RepID=UPI001CF7C338|nr:inactive serine/threonine-protein kinase TEX14-like [Varanus komodoensis]